MCYLDKLILPGKYVIHINRNPFDCRKCNLADVDKVQMSYYSSPRSGKSRTSLYKGVSKNASGKWNVKLDRLQIGTFNNEEEAARRYDEEVKRRAKYPYLNFP